MTQPQKYRLKVKTALSKMPAMTSSEFYTQMENSLGRKTILIDQSKSGSSNSTGGQKAGSTKGLSR